MSAHRPRWLSRRQLSQCSGALLVTLVAVGPALPADRPDEAARDERVIQLPPVQVTAPAPLPETLPRHWVPAAVDILERTEIGPPRPSVLPDVLERLPGVTLQNEQGNPFQPTLTLRGFVVSPVTGLPQGVSVFLDGVRLNEPTVEEVNFDLIPLEAVDRIEVIRGPSVLFGRNTLGAAISLTTRRGEERREIVTEVSGGSFGRLNTRLSMSGESRPLDYYLSLTGIREDGYRDDTESRLARAFAKVGVRAAGLDATVSYQYGNNRIRQAGSLPQSELGRDRRANFTAGDFFAPELHLAILNVRYPVGESVTVEGNAFVRALSAEQFNVNLIAANTRLVNSNLSTGGRLQVSHRDTVIGHDNVVILGAEYARTRVTSRTFEESGGAESLEADLIDVQHAAGLYAQDTLVMARGFAGPRSSIVLTVAARWDYLRHEIDDRLGGPSGGVNGFSRLNPRVGVNVNPSERLGFFASYSEGFRAPAFLELTCAGPGAVCPGLQVGVAPDPPLKAVTARNYEVGVDARPFTWLDVHATAYRTDVGDDIFSVSPTGTTGVFFQNVGRTRREGAEVGLRGRMGTALEGYVNYAYTRATFLESIELTTPLPPGLQFVPAGSSLALVPRHRLNAGLAYRPWPWLTLSTDARYVGSQFLRGDEANRQRPLPAFWVLNGGLAARWGGFEAFIRVNNVLDNRYETFGTFAPNGRLPGNPIERFLTPAPPINALAGLQYEY
jgi:iron complex outermembrane receptor protein